MPEKNPLDEVIQAIQGGQRRQGKELLTRLLRSDEVTAEQWLWMSAAVETEKEQIFCLQRALKVDPNCVAAKRGLVVLGALSRDEAALPPADGLETFRLKPPPEVKGARPAVPMLWLGVGLGAVVVIGLVVGGVALVGKLLAPPKPTAVGVIVWPTAVVGPSSTPASTLAPGQVRCTPPPVFNAATPLAVYLCASQPAPTPNPIPTEKSSIEAYSTVQRAYTQGNWDTVITRGEDLIKKYPDKIPQFTQLYFYMAEAYRYRGNTGDMTRAYQNYTTAISKNSDFAPAYWGRALTNPAGAIDDFQRAIKTDPNFIPAYLGLAATYTGNVNYPQALNTLKQAKSVAPGSALVLASLAMAYADSGKPQEALDAAMQALAVDDSLPLAYFARGRAEYGLGNYTAADSDLSLAYQYVLTLDVPYADLFQANVYYAYGLAKVAIADDDSALAAFNRAFAARSATPPLPLYLARGQLYLRQKNYDGAGTDFNKIITALQGSKDPLLVDAYFGNGLAWLGRDKPDSALSNFQMVTRLAPDRFDGNFYLGQDFLLLGQAKDALAPLTAALGLAKTDADRAGIYKFRAQAYQALGMAAEQIADLSALAALSKAPGGAAATAVAQLTQIGPLPTATITPTVTLTPTATLKGGAPKPTATPKVTATPTLTATPKALPTGTPTATSGVIATPTLTGTPKPTLTFTPTAKKP